MTASSLTHVSFRDPQYVPSKQGETTGSNSKVMKIVMLVSGVSALATSFFASIDPSPTSMSSLAFFMGMSMTMYTLTSLATPAKTQNPVSTQLRSLNDVSCPSSLEGIFTTTNERRVDETLKVLEKSPKVEKGAHIGFSTWFNFTIAWKRRSSFVLICDHNRCNKVFIDKTLETLKSTQKREDFIEKIWSYVLEVSKKNGKYLKDGAIDKVMLFTLNIATKYPSPEAEIRGELTRKGSWLELDESYEYIRSLAFTDRIVPISVDIRDTKRFEKIAQIFRKNTIPIDTLYTSNICDFMEKSKDKRDFVATVRALAASDTLLINCPLPRLNTPQQEIYRFGSLSSLESRIGLFVSLKRGIHSSYVRQVAADLNE